MRVVVEESFASGLAQCRQDFTRLVDGLAEGKLITGSRMKVDLALGSPSCLKILSLFFHIKRMYKINGQQIQPMDKLIDLHWAWHTASSLLAYLMRREKERITYKTN